MTEGAHFGESRFSDEDRRMVQQLLENRLGKQELSWREGPRGLVPYLTIDTAAELANRVFGSAGWSSEIHSVSVDYVEETEPGRWNASASAVVRVELRDGTHHEDVGCGVVEGKATRQQALELARKAAASDGLKRALRLFGNYLGNSAYSEEYVRDVRRELAGQQFPMGPDRVPCQFSTGHTHVNP
eukprot:m51a1_g11074 hypothetical protein (186) ;mRNA; r:560082-560694